MGQTAPKSKLLGSQSDPEIAFAIMRTVQGHLDPALVEKVLDIA